MLTMTTVFEAKARRPIELAHVIAGCILAAILGLFALFSPMCDGGTSPSDEERAQIQVNDLAVHIDVGRCVGPHATERRLLRDPWNRQLRLYCALPMGGLRCRWRAVEPRRCGEPTDLWASRRALSMSVQSPCCCSRGAPDVVRVAERQRYGQKP